MVFFRFQNIADGNGWEISMVGVFIVFISLAIISLFINYLPRVLAIMDKYMPETKAGHHQPEIKTETDNSQLVAAIGFALHEHRFKNTN